MGKADIERITVKKAFDSAFRQGSELFEDLFGVGMPTGGLLRVDEVAVHDDFEDPAAGGDQGDVVGGVLELLEDLRRQTDGSVEVASDRAVFDRDLHQGTSSETTSAGPDRNRRDGSMLVDMSAARTGVLQPAPPKESAGGGGGRWAWLLTAKDAVEAEIIRGLLEAGGVPVALDWRDPSPFAWMHLSGNLFRPVPVYVPASLIDSARLHLLDLGLDAADDEGELDEEEPGDSFAIPAWRDRHRFVLRATTALTLLAVGWMIFVEIFGFAPCFLRLFCI
jgi:hypothetical protein